MKLKPGYLTQAEILAKTRMTAKTFRRWRAAGLLGETVINGHRCYSEDVVDLINFIKNMKVRSLEARAKLLSMPIIEEVEIYTEEGLSKVPVVANLLKIEKNGKVYEHKRLRDGSYLTLIKHKGK